VLDWLSATTDRNPALARLPKPKMGKAAEATIAKQSLVSCDCMPTASETVHGRTIRSKHNTFAAKSLQKQRSSGGHRKETEKAGITRLGDSIQTITRVNKILRNFFASLPEHRLEFVSRSQRSKRIEGRRRTGSAWILATDVLALI
jgi:hypothetical protein